MEKIRRTQTDMRRQKSTPRPLTSEDIIRQANAILNLKSKEPTMTAADYRNFLQAQKDLLTETTEPLLPRRLTLTKKPSDYKTSLVPVLRHTPVQSTKPQVPSRSGDSKLFEDSKLGSLEDFTLGKLIGTGAYASVKSAISKVEGKKFALKIYEKYRLADPSKKKNVGREIEILKKLDHPNIVKMFEVIETPKQLHLVLEHVPGGSLGAFLKKKPSRRLEEYECKNLFRQLVSAIDYVHSQKVTHRDLKLENLLMNLDNSAIKVIDFGFSTCFSHEKKVKLFCGTPTYMAPEIVTRKEYSGPPADVWALGILLFVMLSGCFPFKAPTDRELFKKIEKGIFSIPSHVSAGARALIHKILNVNPEERPKARDIIMDSWLCDMAEIDN
jgi:MAP/microtubule affinity-regulating kinase